MVKFKNSVVHSVILPVTAAAAPKTNVLEMADEKYVGVRILENIVAGRAAGSGLSEILSTSLTNRIDLTSSVCVALG